MKRIVPILALTLALAGCSACSLTAVPQQVVNVCTTAAMVYDPVQIAILAAAQSPAVSQSVKEKLGTADTRAMQGLHLCLTAVEASNPTDVKAAVAGVAAATAEALKALGEAK